MQIAATGLSSMNNEAAMACVIKEVTTNHLSSVKDSQWHCDCILEALALGDFMLALKGLKNYLNGLGNQLPLHSREILMELIQAASAGKAGRVAQCSQQLTEYHRSLGLCQGARQAIASANLGVFNSHPPTDKQGPSIIILN